MNRIQNTKHLNTTQVCLPKWVSLGFISYVLDFQHRSYEFLPMALHGASKRCKIVLSKTFNKVNVKSILLFNCK